MMSMTIPDWRTSAKGSRIRAALWLHAEVGTGGTFTKQQLRDAFPNIEQIDRRVRDLRAEGWIIATYREDRSLSSVDELRLVRQGGRVWEEGYQSLQRNTITDAARRETFAADNYLCLFCGIGAGEVYADETLRTAKLGVIRLGALVNGSRQLATCCDRCRAGRHEEATTDLFWAAVEALTPQQGEQLAEWIRAGRRLLAPEHHAWSLYHRLPVDVRNVVKAKIIDHRDASW